MKHVLAFLALAFAVVSSSIAGEGPAVDASWQQAALAGIAAAEYRFSWNGGDLSAPNRAHDLRTRVRQDGFSLLSRTSEDAFRLELRLLDQGEGIVAEGNGRAEIRRPNLTEWLANGPRGVEHGITVDGDDAGPLVLRFALGGDVLAYPEDAAGTSVLFRNGRESRWSATAGWRRWTHAGKSSPRAWTCPSGS
jgi:hypothetical protein